MNGKTGVGNQILREYGIILFLLLLFSSFFGYKKPEDNYFFW